MALIEFDLQAPWTAIYVKVMAGVLLYGATVHIGNIAGLTGMPWLYTSLFWRSMDVMLLVFNVVVAITLGGVSPGLYGLCLVALPCYSSYPMRCLGQTLSSSQKMLKR